MRKSTTSTLLLAALLCLTISCKSEPEQSIEDLKVAINGEAKASASYAEFSKKAQAEGYQNIANLFAATSKSEEVHVKNHKKALSKLGEPFVETVPPIEVLTTAENLKTALDGENYEVDKMYPPFIAAAKNNYVGGAKKSFTWARNVEKVHARIYDDVIRVLAEKGNDGQISKIWFVCPTCGNTYSTLKGLLLCEVCGAFPGSFIVFE